MRLTALDLRPEALREWSYIVRGLDDEGLLLAAQFAQRSGLYDRSINSADRTQRRHDFALRYQTPYRDEIGEAARKNGLDEAWVFGLTRQESRFVADIVSSAGATGLMQLMRPTAKWVAKQTGRSDFVQTQLEQPVVNAELGSYYLRYVLDRLDGLPVLATAAYNAGPGRAQAWRGATPLEGAVYAETIPFNETRDYVKKVLSNAMFYQAQLGLALCSTQGPARRRSAARRRCPWRRFPRRIEARWRDESIDRARPGRQRVRRTPLVAALVAAGHRVVVPTRRREAAKHLILLPTVDVVEADIHDEGTLGRLMARADVAINLVGILNESRKGDFDRVHVELTRKVIAACRASGVRRLLHMSALNADVRGPSRYLQSKGEAEAIVRESGLAWTVFRPSVIFGREDAFLNLFATLQRMLPVVALGCAERPLPARLCRRRGVRFPQVAGRRSHARSVLFAVRSQGLHACASWSPTWASCLDTPADRRARPGADLVAGACSRDAPRLDHEPRQRGVDGQGQRLRLSLSAGVRGPPTALEAIAPEYLAPERRPSHFDQFRAERSR